MSYLKHFSNPLSTFHEDLFYITRDRSRRWDVVSWTAGLHEALKSSITHNIEWAHVFCDPTNYLGPIYEGWKSFFKIFEQTYLVSVFVCCVCEYVTFPLPFARSNEAVNNALPSPDFTTMVRARSTSLVSSAAFITSVPQHIFACLRRLLVEEASPLSTKRFTHLGDFPFPLQDFARQEKTCARRPLKYSIAGTDLKNA